MLTTDPKQALLDRAASLVGKTSAASVLWKYTDEEGGEFYLPEKKTGPMKSPYSGKSFTAKPERSSMNDVSKELKEEGAKVKGALFKYVDGDGKEFYLPKRVTSPLKSPYSGKSFTPKAEKSNLSEVSKELKGKEASAPEPTAWKVQASTPRQVMAGEILAQGEQHEIMRVLKAQYDAILNATKIEGAQDAPGVVLAKVKPEVQKLAHIASVIAQQMEDRLS